MFESPDFVYTPTEDVDAAARRYVEELGATLKWKVRAMGTVVACLRVAGAGPGDPSHRSRRAPAHVGRGAKCCSKTRPRS